MNERPKFNEDEDAILRMQENYFAEKRKNKDLKPSAQCIDLRPKKRQIEETTTRKISKYAQSKGLKGRSEKHVRIDPSTNVLVGDILEKNQGEPALEDDQVYYPKVISSVLGNIVENNVDNYIDFNTKPMPSKGFPLVTKRDTNESTIPYKDLKSNELETQKMDVDVPLSQSEANTINVPNKSYILSSKNADEIHDGNVKVLSSMSEKQILDEKHKLLSTLDPKLVEFLKAKRLGNTSTFNQSKDSTSKVSEEIIPSVVSAENSNTIESMDTSTNSTEIKYDSLWDNDVLSHPDINKWLHFDSLEKDKLKWLKGIEDSKRINPDEPYEARFDFKGYLMPYTMEYTEKTKTLFHHGEEPHRPGYSLTELIELSRSAVIQQRVMALNTIAGILEYHSIGAYKDIIDIPISKIFFIIRIAIDENRIILLEPALKAMRNMLYNRVDEASLDALLGLEEQTQPSLQNDKAEIEDLDSKEDELKDFHLAEIDLITALLRTNILQRFYYILDVVKPHFNCVQYSLQILTRLVRDSAETALKIVEKENLMKTIFTNFVPAASVNFIFEPQMVYHGRPIISALKLLRVLSLQSYQIGQILLTEYDIMVLMSRYVSSAVDSTYGLRVQLEAFSIISNILSHGIGVNETVELYPVLISTLYDHTRKTDATVNTQILLSTHAAVVLQLINKLLLCNIPKINNNKSHIYPLLKDGVKKWITQIGQAHLFTSGHLKLVCAALDCCRVVMIIENLPIKILNDTLKLFGTTQGFDTIIKNLVHCSNLLSGLENKDLHITKNLMSLRGTVIDSAQKLLPILNITSPIPFLSSLYKLLTHITDKELLELFFNPLLPYLEKLAKATPSLCDNWFTRIESDFVFNIVKLATTIEIAEEHKDVVYSIANKLCYILRKNKRLEMKYLFNRIVFNTQWFTAERLLNLVNVSDTDSFSKALISIDSIRQCYSNVIDINSINTWPKGNNVLLNWTEPFLPRDWIYLPILSLYSVSQEVDTSPKVVGQHAEKVAVQLAKKKEFILRSSLEWILFNEVCFPDLISDIDVTDRFCRIMCVFLCDNSMFLDEKIKVLLQQCMKVIFKKKLLFNFDKELVGLHNFQDFYTQFLEQFQSVSYGDHNFAACLLVPLAQRHNVKWRTVVWSEYAGCLRALDCPEELLCYQFYEYLNPEETDDSLIKSYFNAVNSNLLRPNTIAHKIATHHIEAYKRRMDAKLKD